MPISRNARTHLVYQFIILTLVFLGIGYYELLLERKYLLFLAFVPLFLYQLVILSCCTDLLPVPRWMNLGESPNRETNEQLAGSPAPPEQCVSPEELVAVTEKRGNSTIENCNIKSRTYKFRNWKASSPNGEKSVLQSPSVSYSVSGTSPTGKSDEMTLGHKNSNQLQNSELTKKYFFPFREKRLEQWIESKENIRPYKIKSWETDVNDNSDSDLLPTSSTSEVTSTEIPTGDPFSNHSTPQGSELTKSFSFPFRQKHLAEWKESREDSAEDSINRPPTPYWKTVGYSVAVKQEARRRRRSVSSSRLTREGLNSPKESDQCKDFTQSMEISNTPNMRIACFRSNTPKLPSTAFTRIKLGISNYFSKMKKEHCKINPDLEIENKRRPLKSFFQSVENINFDSLEREQTPKTKFDSKETPRFYPAYIPFEKNRFEKDVRKRMSELPKA